MEVIGDIDKGYFKERRNGRLFRRDSKEKERRTIRESAYRPSLSFPTYFILSYLCFSSLPSLTGLYFLP